MRRWSRVRWRRRATVAVYDALLFLMVAILVSAGIFLYSATTMSEGGDLSDAAYQHMCDNQRVMVEGLAANDTLPSPELDWTDGTSNGTEPLVDVTGPVEAATVRWMLSSYSMLTYGNDHPGGPGSRTWSTDPILSMVDAIFAGSRLNGTEHAWLFLYEGQQVLFGSSTADRVEDLPSDRWASSRDYSFTNATVEYSAKLTYFLWIA